MKTTHLIIALLVLLALGAAAYILTNGGTTTVTEPNLAATNESIPVEPDNGIGDGAESLDELVGDEPVVDSLSFTNETVIGQSVKGEDIIANHWKRTTNPFSSKRITCTGGHARYRRHHS